MKDISRKGSVVIFLVPVILLLIVASVFFFKDTLFPQKTQEFSKPIIIGFSLGTLQEERWQKDRDQFLKEIKTMDNVSLLVEASNNNSETQISQIESMISKGVDVLIVVPYDATALSDVIAKAHQSGIKVLSYDRLILDSSVDVYLSFDNEKVGELEAKGVIDALKQKLSDNNKLKIAYVGGSTTDNNAKLLREGSYKILQPLIDSGKIEIVMDEFTPNWDPDNAYKNFKKYLVSSGGQIDGVIAANDGTAGGVIKALSEYKLDGIVPVSGQDAELAALQRIAQGTQTITVYKPIPNLVASGIDIAVKLANGETVKTNATVNDGKVDIPSVLLDPIAVTKENIEDTVVKDGYHTSSEIYK